MRLKFIKMGNSKVFISKKTINNTLSPRYLFGHAGLYILVGGLS